MPAWAAPGAAGESEQREAFTYRMQMNRGGVFTFSGLTLSKRAPGTRPGGKVPTKDRTTPHPGVRGRRGRRAGVVGRHGCARPGQAVKGTGEELGRAAGGGRPQPAESGNWPRRFGPSRGLVSARNSVGAVTPNGRLYPFPAIRLGPGNGTRAQVRAGRRAGASRAAWGLVGFTRRTKACGPKCWGTRAHEWGAARPKALTRGVDRGLAPGGTRGGQRGAAEQGVPGHESERRAGVRPAGRSVLPGASSGPNSYRGAQEPGGCPP
ncbi:hypothetical protein WA016_01866 [Myxococcus stipitatus]